MTTLEKRAKNWAGTYPRLLDNEYTNDDVTAMIENSYIQGATDQRKIDTEKVYHALEKILSRDMLDNVRKILEEES